MPGHPTPRTPRTFSRGRWRPLVVAGAVTALFLAGCGDSDPDDEAAETPPAEAADGDGNGDDAEGGEEFAEATWQGEELSFRGVSCSTLPAGENYEIRGRGDGFYLQARFPVDLAADGDSDQPALESDVPSRLILFFQGDGGTIGDGEGYDASGEDLAGLDASAGHVAGTVDLAPDTSTRADEVNPDGGTLEFELRC